MTSADKRLEDKTTGYKILKCFPPSVYAHISDESIYNVIALIEKECKAAYQRGVNDQYNFMMELNQNFFKEHGISPSKFSFKDFNVKEAKTPFPQQELSKEVEK